MKIQPSELCTDTEFVRRVYLDLVGLPPTPTVSARVPGGRADDCCQAVAALIDRLIGSQEFVDHWTNKWADLLQVNRKFLGEVQAQVHCTIGSRTQLLPTCRTISSRTNSDG